MVRQVKQTIKDDVDLIAMAFPNPAIQAAVIEAYLKTAGAIFEEA